MYALLIVGLLAVVGFLFVLYSQNTGVAVKDREYVKGVDVNDLPALKEAMNPKDKEPKEKERKILGGLMNNCPCADGYECSVTEGNICKIKEGATCRFDSECSESAFCFNSACTVKPALPEDRLVIRNTPMLLNHNRFTIPPAWWKITDLVDACQSLKDLNAFYVLTDQGRIFKVDTNPKVTGVLEISQVTKMESIFTYDKHYYGLAGGFLYQLENENERVWNWGKVNKFYKQNIAAYEIYSASTVDDLILLFTDQGLIKYDREIDEWSPSNPNSSEKEKEGEEGEDEEDKGEEEKIRKIVFGRNRNIFIQEDHKGKIVFHQNGVNHELDEGIIDFAVNKENDHIIYVLYPNKTCFVNIYDRKDNGADDVSMKILGKAEKIMAFKGSFWGLSSTEKYDFDQ